MRTILVIGLLAALGLWACTYAQEPWVKVNPEAVQEITDHDCNSSHPGQDVHCIQEAEDDGLITAEMLWGENWQFENFPIVTCDPRKAFDAYGKAKEQWATLAEIRANLGRQAQARSKIATDKLAELEKEKEGSRKWQKLFEELATIKADNVVWLNLVNSQIATKNSQIIKEGYADVSEAVARVAKAKGVNLVLSNVNALPGQLLVLYADDALDITDDVIEVLNSKEQND